MLAIQGWSLPGMRAVTSAIASAWAAWPSDPPSTPPLCTATGTQQNPAIVTDGAGGAIVTWVDCRSGACRIYAQRISADGVPQWTTDGIALGAAPTTSSQSWPAIASDGDGGAIVVWEEVPITGYRDIYAQRVSRDSELLWTATGLPVCTATRRSSLPHRCRRCGWRHHQLER